MAPREWAVLVRRALPFLVAAIVLSVIAAITLTLYARASTPIRAAGAPEEQVLNYMAGENFASHGFFSRQFLTDYSLDPSPQGQPIYYTHFPPLPSIIIGGLIEVGLDSLHKVSLVMNLIFLAGLALLLLFFWRLLTPWHGIGVLIFLVFGNPVVLAWADHVVYAYWFGLTFLALWVLTQPGKSSRFLGLGFITILLISWLNVVQLAITLATLAGLWVIRMPNLTLRRTLVASAVGLGGVVLHILHNMLAVGGSVAIRDVLFTLGNRTIGWPSREVVLEFARENDLILWGASELGPLGSRLGWIWAEYRYFLIPLSISLVGLGLLAYLRRSPTAAFSLKLAGVFTVASGAWHIVFQAHSQVYPLPLAIVLPVAMTCGFFVGELVPLLPQQFKALCRAGIKAWNLKALLFPALLAVAGSVTLWQGISLGLGNFTAEPLLPTVRELEILQDFRGQGFWTNVTPHMVAYYTRSWVIGQLPLDALKELDASKAFVTTVSKRSPTWQEASKPSYFFFSQNNVVLNTPDRGLRLELYRHYLEENYLVVAWSPYGSMVVDLSRPADPANRVMGRQQFDLSGYDGIPLSEAQLSVSSSLDPTAGKGNLIRPGSEGFWHLENPRRDPAAWVAIDLGQKRSISLLRLRPWEGHPNLMWDGYASRLQVSENGVDWEDIATLGIERARLQDDWIYFPLPSPQEGRYFRLIVWDMGFLSLGRLELYASQGTPLPSPPTPTLQPPPAPQGPIIDGTQRFDLSNYDRITLSEAQLSVSNFLPPMGKANLVQPGTDGIWHLENPRTDPAAWVAIDLGEKLPVSILRLRPRTGLISQMWDGYAARLQVSDNGVDWEDVVTLGIERARLQDDWIYFPLPSPQEGRYFRLIVEDMGFMSLGRLELYAPQR